MSNKLQRVKTRLVLAIAISLACPAAFAQVLAPGNLPAGQAQLTPEQALGIAQMRALQSRRRGQVRTGVPQFIPMGPQGMTGPFDASFGAASMTPEQSSSQKRAEARQVRDEKKRAARDNAKTAGGSKKAKKAKPDAKAKAADKAKSDKKAKSVKKPAAKK